MQMVLKSKNVFLYFSVAQNIAGNMAWKKKKANCFYISSGKKNSNAFFMICCCKPLVREEVFASLPSLVQWILMSH